jgi:hypothetical protein
MALDKSDNAMWELCKESVRMERISSLRNTYLVQRLQKPYPGCENNPFNFGGGLRCGGLNKEAFDVINKVFKFDYMGAAEFEFGAVAKSIKNIVEYLQKVEGVYGQFKIQGLPIYYICHASVEADVKERIKELSSPYRKFRTKEAVLFNEAIGARKDSTLKTDDKYRQHLLNYVGWLELENHFMFFIDKTTFEQFYELVTDKKPVIK